MYSFQIIFPSDFSFANDASPFRVTRISKKDDHKWWYLLLVLRKSLSLIEPYPNELLTQLKPLARKQGPQPHQRIPIFSDDGGPNMISHSALISAVVTRIWISAVEDTLVFAWGLRRWKIKSMCSAERQLSSTTMNLEEMVLRVDKKVTELAKMSVELIGPLNIYFMMKLGEQYWKYQIIIYATTM